jgi:hypothetical protein
VVGRKPDSLFQSPSTKGCWKKYRYSVGGFQQKLPAILIGLESRQFRSSTIHADVALAGSDS